MSAEFARAAGPQVELTRAIGCEPSQPRDKAWIGDHGKLKSAKAGFVLGIAECDHTDWGLVPGSWQSEILHLQLQQFSRAQEALEPDTNQERESKVSEHFSILGGCKSLRDSEGEECPNKVLRHGDSALERRLKLPGFDAIPAAAKLAAKLTANRLNTQNGVAGRDKLATASVQLSTYAQRT